MSYFNIIYNFVKNENELIIILIIYLNFGFSIINLYTYFGVAVENLC